MENTASFNGINTIQWKWDCDSACFKAVMEHELLCSAKETRFLVMAVLVKGSNITFFTMTGLEG